MIERFRSNLFVPFQDWKRMRCDSCKSRLLLFKSQSLCKLSLEILLHDLKSWMGMKISENWIEIKYSSSVIEYGILNGSYEIFSWLCSKQKKKFQVSKQVVLLRWLLKKKKKIKHYDVRWSNDNCGKIGHFSCKFVLQTSPSMLKYPNKWPDVITCGRTIKRVFVILQHLWCRHPSHVRICEGSVWSHNM